jgi:hypothetical protein
MKTLAMLAAFTTIAATGLTATAYAAEQSNFPDYVAFDRGNQLLDECNPASGYNSFASGMCIGYVTATVDTLSFIPGMGFCLPLASTKGQIRDVVLKYLQDHPADRHSVAASLVTVALWESFPCPTKPKATS